MAKESGVPDEDHRLVITLKQLVTFTHDPTVIGGDDDDDNDKDDGEKDDDERKDDDDDDDNNESDGEDDSVGGFCAKDKFPTPSTQ